MTSLNPAFTLGDQLSEAVMRHQTISRAEAMTVALQILEKVQIPKTQRCALRLTRISFPAVCASA